MKFFTMSLLLVMSSMLLAQTPGLIYYPPGGMGVTPLNPNGNAWSSISSTGYTTNDVIESEIPFQPLPVPYAEPTSDLVRGPDCRFSDIVRIDEYDSGVYMYSDGTNLMFRFRQGNTIPGSKGYSILIDTDMKFGCCGPNRDPNYIAKTTGINGNAGFEIEIVLETNFRVAMYNVDGIDNPSVPVRAYPLPGTHHQRSVALTNNCDDPDYFHDFYVIIADLYADFGINNSTPLRYAATTVMAPKPAVGGPISDINGGGNYEDIINYQCGTALGAPPTSGPPCSCTNPPTLNSPIPSGTNVLITGNWSPTTSFKPRDAVINVFVNSSFQGATNTTDGAGWGVTVPGPLVNGDTIFATAQAVGEGVCSPNPQIVIVSDCNAGNTPAAPLLDCIGNKGIRGHTVTRALPNATIRIYRYLGPPASPMEQLAVTITADASGNWGWDGLVAANDLSSNICNSGPGDMLEGTYRITQQASTGPTCPSPPTSICLDRNGNGFPLSGNSVQPVITTNPIAAGTVTVAGTAPVNAGGTRVRLYVNGVLRTTQTTTTGNFSFVSVFLNASDIVTVTAQENLRCESTPASRVVSCILAAPLITANDLGQVASGAFIRGTSTEIGATVNIYNNAAPTVIIGTGTVLAGGAWTSNFSAIAGNTYFARVTRACGTSAASNLVSALGPTSNRCGSFTNTPYNNLTVSVTGTLTSAVANTTVNLYEDGHLIGSVVTSTVNWSIAIPALTLYGGGILTFGVQQTGLMEFRCPTSTTVDCAKPPMFTYTPSNLTISSVDGTATFHLSGTTAGVLYVVEDATAPYVDRGVSIFSSGANFDLVTFPFLVEGTYNIRLRGMTFDGFGCERFGLATIIVPDAGVDSITNVLDIDDDEDGIPDVIESCGIGATSFSCLLGGGDPSYDHDGDGVLNYRDPDFCTLNSAGVCAILDADGDGIINQFDLDSDNDGIPDIVEVGGVDVNGDGLIDGLIDTDGDGLMDLYDNDNTDGPKGTSPCTPQPTCVRARSTSKILDVDKDGVTDADIDFDNDGLPDYLDLDADNDGIPDVVEAGGTDENGDGRIDNYADIDNDGFCDLVDGLDQRDVNNNSIPDFADIIFTAGTDADTDGIDDAFDASITGGPDVNGDGIDDNTTNKLSALIRTNADGDNDGRPDGYPQGDIDGDGNLEYLDLDSDNDGIPDIVEAGGADVNNDGMADNLADPDNDGFSNLYDKDINNDGTMDAGPTPMIITSADANSDGRPDAGMEGGQFDNDGVPNHLDLDSDNDGILDVVEAGLGASDVNRDGILDDALTNDGDNNGWSNTADQTNGGTSPIQTVDGDANGYPNSYTTGDFEGDVHPNFLDIDADNDGIVDNTEGQATIGYIAPAFADADGDGIDDAYDNNDALFGGAGSGIIPVNKDKLDNPDYLDLDTDNDGILDLIEGHDTNGDGVVNGSDAPNANTGIGGGADLDGDGLLDGFDNNTASTIATNTALNPNSHPDVHNTKTIERDWREANSTYATNDINTTPVNVTVTGNVLTNDIDLEGDAQTLTALTVDTDGDGIPDGSVAIGTPIAVAGVNENGTPAVNAGTLTQNVNGTYTFVPAPDFVGEITYSYRVCDNGSPVVCATATVTIDVEPAPGTENGELAPAPDWNITHDGIPVSGQVLVNDNDPDGDVLTVTGPIDVDTNGDGIVDATAPLGAPFSIAGVTVEGTPFLNAGTIIQNPNGTYTFSPVPGFIGVVNYLYTVCDNGIPMLCEKTTVTIRVLPALYNSTNAIDDEEFLDQGATLIANVLDNDFDVEGHVQSGGVTLVSGTSNGALTLNADGSYSYTPTSPIFSGTDKFVYRVCDSGIPQECDLATVYITILPVSRDFGDGPIPYGIASHRAIKDVNSDNILDGGSDVWLGVGTSFETSTKPVDVDDFDDAMALGTNTAGAFPRTVNPSTVYAVDLGLNSTSAATISYGMWVDWDNDGIYEDFYQATEGVAASGARTVVVNVTSPAIVTTTLVNIRLRVHHNPLVLADFQGQKTNGEVEDYQFLMNDPLPVEMLYFNAKLQNRNTAVLDWATATELNNAGYDIEHALPTTGTPEFKKVGFVTGFGTTVNTQYYNYEVPNLIPGVHYFRLKQVDFDGTFSYTAVRALEVKGSLVQELFPTILSESSRTIYVKVPQDGEYTLEVITPLGQVVQAVTQKLSATAYFELQLELEKYTSGVYFIRVTKDEESYTTKIKVE